MAEQITAQATMAEPDSVDWAILEILQNDASISNKDLAQRVHLAPSSCLERVRRLRQRHVIKGIHAEVDPRALGRPEQALLAVQVRPHSRETAKDFVSRALDLPETLALYNVSGTEDYLIHVAVPDSTALQALILDRLLTMPQVAHCRTQLIFGTPLTAPIRRLAPGAETRQPVG